MSWLPCCTLLLHRFSKKLCSRLPAPLHLLFASHSTFITGQIHVSDELRAKDLGVEIRRGTAELQELDVVRLSFRISSRARPHAWPI